MTQTNRYTRIAFVLSLLLPLSGCGDPTGSRQLPPRFTITGQAQRMVEGWTLECSFAVDVTGTMKTADGFTGDMYGEILRQLRGPSGEGWEFLATLANPHFDVRRSGRAVTVSLGGNQPVTARPFWRALEGMTATEGAPWVFAGGWTCDTMGTDLEIGPGAAAAGTWVLQPGN
jgi:hypothetical protein